MFLPVLLVRDYGLWGFWVFAIPNVVGAGAMGWVLRSRGRSAALVAEHGGAAGAFSVVTIAFHLYVSAWVVRELTGAFAPALIVAAVAFFLVHHRPVREAWAGVAAWVISLGLAGAFLATVGWSGVAAGVTATGAGRGVDLWPLGAVCVFGFLLCPYLDLTFHRARQHTSEGGARVAFGVGFGVVFFSMILFTLAYARVVLPVVGGGAVVPRVAGYLIGAHMAVQAGVTLAYHYQAIEPRLAAGGRVLPGFLAAVAAPLMLGAVVRWGPGAFGLSAGEIGYRVFLSAYGLFFPAYVYLRMTPGRRASMGVYWAACACALPFFFVAFVMGHMMWLLAGLGVVLAARALPARGGIGRVRTELPPSGL